MGSSSRRVKNKKKQHGGAHRTKRSDRVNLRKAQAVQHVDKQVDDTEPIVENNGNNDVPENVLLNAEIDPVDIVPGSSVMHVDVSDEEMEVSAPCSDINVTAQRKSRQTTRMPFSCTDSDLVSNVEIDPVDMIHESSAIDVIEEEMEVVVGHTAQRKSSRRTSRRPFSCTESGLSTNAPSPQDLRAQQRGGIFGFFLFVDGWGYQ